MATFTGTAGADNFVGAANVADTFNFTPGTLTGIDTVVGGGGAVADLLQFTAAGAVLSGAFANVSGIENIRLFSGGNTVTLTNALVASAEGGFMRVFGGAGNDTVNAALVTGAGLFVSFITGDGNDTLTGSAGGDTFAFEFADFNGADTIFAGAGNDQLIFTTNAALTGALLAGVSSVEHIRFAGGGTNSVVLDAAFMNTVSGGILTVSGGAGNDTVNGSALVSLNHRLSVLAGAGNDTVLGGLGADQVFFAGADLNASDTVVGGGGNSDDRITFTSAVNLVAGAFAGVSQIEAIDLAAGTNALQVSNALVTSARNNLLVLNGSGGNDTIDASLVTTASNRVQITAGTGIDTLIGGSGNDLIHFHNPSELNSADIVIGGAGSDLLRFLNSGAVTASALANVSGIETVRLASTGTNSIALTNALVSSALNRTLTALAFSGDDTVDGSGVTTAANRLIFNTGAGNDTLIGGAGDDVFQFLVQDLTGADTVVGGGGNNVLGFLNAGTITAAALGGVSGVTITLANGTNNLTIPNTIGNHVTINGGSGNDTVNASAMLAGTLLRVTAGAGVDILIGGAGNDLFLFDAANFTSADTVNGGSGSDTLRLSNGGVSAAAFAGTSGIETVLLGDGVNSITLTDAAFAAAFQQTITVVGGSDRNTIDASSVTLGGSRLIASGGAERDALRGGAGNDTLSGGDGVDVLFGGGGVDNLTSGLGGDVFVYTHGSQSSNGEWVNGVLEQATIDTILINGTGDYRFNAAFIDSFAIGVDVPGISISVSANTFMTADTNRDGILGDLSITSLVPLANGIRVFADGGSTSASTGIIVIGVNLGGDDIVTGGSGSDTLEGGAGNDRLIGSYGSDVIRGGAGDDIIQGDSSSDTLSGGDGVDIFVYATRQDSDELSNLDLIEDFGSADQLDFAALRLSTNTSAILNKGTAPYVGSTVDFFNDGGIDRAVAVQTDGTTTRVYVDVNGNGNYDVSLFSGSDLVIAFTGNVLANLTSTSDYIFL